MFTVLAAQSAPARRSEKWKLALEVLTSMASARVLPDVFTFSAAISSCEAEGSLGSGGELS